MHHFEMAYVNGMCFMYICLRKGGDKNVYASVRLGGGGICGRRMCMAYDIPGSAASYTAACTGCTTFMVHCLLVYHVTSVIVLTRF